MFVSFDYCYGPYGHIQMLSSSFLCPHISFTLSHPQSPSLPLLKLRALQNISVSAKFSNTHHLTESRNQSCSSSKSQSSDIFSTFLHDSDNNESFRRSLRSPLLAVWLRSCRSLRDVKRVHLVIVRFFRGQDTYLCNNLISVYVKLGELSYARNVFDEMSQRNVVTWTAIINGYLSFGIDEEALNLFIDSAECGVQPNENMFVCVLKLCCERCDSELGMQIHAAVLKTRRSNMIVESAVVKLYAECGDLVAAFRAFDRMPSRDVVTWTTMITACAQHSRGGDALWLFSRMIDDGFSPNDFTVCGALKASGETRAAGFGRQLHGAVIKKVYSGDDVFVGTSLVDMYAKCGEIKDSRDVFDRMTRRNTATWTAVISGYSRAEQGTTERDKSYVSPGEEALRLFREMTIGRGVAVNDLTMVSALRACGAVGFAAAKTGRELHARAVKSGRFEAPHLGNTLVWFYCRCGEYSTAARVLGAAPQRDVVTWTAMVSGSKEAVVALEALREMLTDGVAPNEHTLSAALGACARAEAGWLGRLLHSAAAKRASAMENVFVGSALIHMYARCGHVEDATRVFEEMSERNLVVWKSMIVGCARMGQCREAMRLVYRMRAEGFEVDDYVRAAVLNACGDGEAELSFEVRDECELECG